jgi:hypothetical protein
MKEQLRAPAPNLRRRWMALGVVAAVLVGACAGLIPPDLVFQVHMDPDLPKGRGDYYLDYEDSTSVFSREGVLIKVRYLTAARLNAETPRLSDGRHVNPYTFAVRDPRRGYVPPRFAVFQVSVANATYAKVELDPARCVLVTDTGEELRYYDAGREGANPLGGNSFSKYYKTELGTSGNDKELNLERMGVVYKTIYHRERPVFRDQQRTGKLVFDPLPEGANAVTLQISDFVLSFDASGNPEETVDVQFRFKVDQRVIELVREE